MAGFFMDFYRWGDLYFDEGGTFMNTGFLTSVRGPAHARRTFTPRWGGLHAERIFYSDGGGALRQKNLYSGVGAAFMYTGLLLRCGVVMNTGFFTPVRGPFMYTVLYLV